MVNIKKDIDWIVKNWDKIPDTFKTNLKCGDRLISDVKMEEHIVILLLDRQKPSVERCWSFNEERISVTRTGKIIWGFDSGCSCPQPWHDTYPNCYSCSNSWKEFVLNAEKFDHGAIDGCLKRIEEIKKSI
jgi:hypothetical protein